MTKPATDHDYQAYPEGSLFSDGRLAGKPDDAPETPTPRHSLAEVAHQIGSLELQQADRWDALTDHNWPPGRTDEKLSTEFPDLRTPEEVEDLEKRRQAAARRREPAKYLRRRVVYVSPRDAGPPEHIAKQVRGE